MDIVVESKVDEVKVITTITQISEEYFNSVLEKHNIYTIIDWNNGSPSYMYKQSSKVIYECDWMTTSGRPKVFESYDIGKLIKDDAKEQGIKLLGVLKVDFGTEYDRFEETTSAVFKRVYFERIKYIR